MADVHDVAKDRAAQRANVERVSREVAASHASSVDAEARFPKETFAALREVGALGAAVPKELGGGGCDVRALADHCQALGRGCAASGMVLAMHHIQVGCLVHHRNGSPEIDGYLRRLCDEQRLIASVTSEVGPSGDMRQSVAAAERDGDQVSLVKRATTISYGAHANDLLITARRNADAASNDQVLFLALDGDYDLRDPGKWDTLGMRGTCSPGATVHARGAAWQVLPAPFADIASETMVPYSHLLWASLWLGIAADAVTRAGKGVRQKARQSPGALPTSARRLSRAVEKLHLAQGQLDALVADYDRMVAAGDTAAMSSLGFVLRVNDLKLTTSETVVDIVTECLRVLGIAAYKNDGEVSLGRHLRDAHSAALMINHDRIRETNASLLLVHKGA